MKILALVVLVPLTLTLISCTSDPNSDSQLESAPDVDQWLTENPNIQSALKFENAGFPSYFYNGTLSESSYLEWSEADKEAFRLQFAYAWNWINYPSGTENLGTQSFTMPVDCPACAANAASDPTAFPITEVTEATGKSVYLAYAAHSVALEVGSTLDWSVVGESDAQLRHIFASRALMQRTYDGTQFFFWKPRRTRL